MATSSFEKEFVISDPKAIKRFMKVFNRKDTGIVIDKEKASDEAMARGEELLRKYLSH